MKYLIQLIIFYSLFTTILIERCEMLISQGWDAETWNGINYMETK